MIPTFFGIIVAALGGLGIWRWSALAMLRMVMLLSLMGGSAALVLSSLGGSTVQPAIMGLGFLFLRCLLAHGTDPGRLAFALRDLSLLLAFAAYGVIGALLLPHIFAGTINVTPLRPIPNHYIYAAYPLAFSPQNITSAVYLTATFLAALCAHAACQSRRAAQTVARTAAVVAIVHATLGLASVVLASTPFSLVLKFFRNGFYAQLEQTMSGFVRMNGIFPEPAVYAAYGFGWLVFVTELWLRDVDRRWTGRAAAILGLTLLASTSTTAMLGLAAYAVIIILRLLLIPGSMSGDRVLILLFSGAAGLAALLGLFVIHPEAAEAFGEFVSVFTIDKAQSASALQRSFWAMQGLDTFRVSYGLGVGPGSFRSSSIATAILGSTGIFGTVLLIGHLLRVFKPLHRTTYLAMTDQRTATGAAASWAAIVVLIPACFSAASPDPGLVWGLLCGMALALRRPPAARRGVILYR